jgi:hypothetical protein
VSCTPHTALTTAGHPLAPIRCTGGLVLIEPLLTVFCWVVWLTHRRFLLLDSPLFQLPPASPLSRHPLAPRGRWSTSSIRTTALTARGCSVFKACSLRWHRHSVLGRVRRGWEEERPYSKRFSQRLPHDRRLQRPQQHPHCESCRINSKGCWAELRCRRRCEEIRLQCERGSRLQLLVATLVRWVQP